MKLSKIRLKHFRQFYGDQEIEFADGDDRNVTIIHAENGVGKTTLLNAVLWAMYGETTNKFEQKELIVNFAALKEGQTVAMVEVYFEHNGSEHMVQRSFNSSKPRDKQTVRAWTIEDGNFVDLPSPMAFINTVIPQSIAKYFFFDGEHAETFAAEKNNKEVNTAIRDILGCRLVETGTKDLKEIRKKLNSEIGNVPGIPDIKNLDQKREAAQRRVDQAVKAITEFESALEVRERQIQQIDQKLRESQGARKLQHFRDQKARDLSQAKGRLERTESEIATWVGEYGVFVGASKLADASLELIEDKTVRGVIPSPYNEEFVKGLLESQNCICDRPLEPESAEFGAVMKLLEKASSADLRRKVLRAQSRIASLKQGARGASDKLKAAYKAREEWINRVNECEIELGEISTQIKGLPEDQSRSQEEARSSLAKEIQDLNRKIGAAKVGLEDDQRAVKQFESERDRILQKGRVAEGLLKRRDLTTKVIEYLERELEDYENSARSAILKMVNDVLEQTSRKSFSAKLERDFSLWMKLDSTQGAAPKSGGENQLLSLAFISALTNFSKKRRGASGGKWVAGTVAPLILDSPFGQLDPTYRESTATFIPKMADQVIMLVSGTQGDPTVLNAIDSRIGAEYVLISHSTGPRGNKPEDRIELRGKEYVRSLYEAERDHTTIERVPPQGAS